MRKLLILLLTPLLLCGCKPKGVPEEEKKYDDYGAFLGRSDNNVSHFSEYSYVSLEFNEFGDSNINRLNAKGVKFLAYLNIGSLENYRDYYDDYESMTFKDYDNWPDERWIDVSNTDWQNFVVNTLAKDFKDRGAYGVYLDNVDVYGVAKEENLNYSAFKQGIKNIIEGITDLGLFVMINGGAEYLEDIKDDEDDAIGRIWGYHQEEIFSLIADYENNGFGKQTTEDSDYYKEIAAMMKSLGKEVFFLEYTTDSTLKEEIKSFCNEKGYHYYISSDVDLK